MSGKMYPQIIRNVLVSLLPLPQYTRWSGIVMAILFQLFLMGFGNSSPADTPVSWTDSDWSSENYAEIAGTCYDNASCSLKLDDDPARMAQMFDFGSEGNDKTGVWDMTLYDNKLYMTACKNPMWENNGYVYEYTDGDVAPRLFHTLDNEQGALYLRVIDDKLYVPGADVNNGSFPDTSDSVGCLYNYDAKTEKWITQRDHIDGDGTDHNADIIKYNGNLYLTNNIARGADVSRSIVLKSVNDGMTWTKDYASNYWGMTKMIVFNNCLYVSNGSAPSFYAWDPTTENKLLKFDGASWKEIAFASNMGNEKVVSFAIFNNTLYLGCLAGVYKYDEATETAVLVLNTSQHVNGFAEHNGRLYTVLGNAYGPYYVNGVDKREVWFYTYLGGWTTNRTDINDAQLWSTEDGTIWSKTCDIDEDEALSISSYGGRLFVGTGTSVSGQYGKLYVSPYMDSGYLMSNSHDMGRAVDFTAISWVGDTGGGTAIKFQLRTAATEEELSGKEFLGPSGTTEDYYETSGTAVNPVHDGDRWVQYKACLSTTDTLCAPSLRSVTITAEIPMPTVLFTAASQSVPENCGTATISLQLSTVCDLPVSVPFTVAGTATAVTDYTIDASPIVIPPGETTAAISVTILDDAIHEADETVIVVMGSPTNATPGDVFVHKLTIANDDDVGSYSISGTVSGDIQAGVTISLSGTSTASTTTAANGTYSFAELTNGNYTLIPSMTGYSFTPASKSVTISGANATGQNFTALAAAGIYSISGTVSGDTQAGVTISLSGAATALTATDDNGAYSFAGLANGSYTLTPSKTGYTFTPSNKSVTINGANITGQNFTAAQDSPPEPESDILVTIGSTFSVTCSESLDKKPIVYAKGADGKKKSVKITNKSSEFPRADNINCLWKAKCKAGDYDIYVKGKTNKIKIEEKVGTVTVVPPEITDLSSTDLSAPGEIITVSGNYFGIKPKVWFTYDCTLCGKLKTMKKSCKIISKSFTADTGESAMNICVPKFKDGAENFILHINSGIGEGTSNF